MIMPQGIQGIQSIPNMTPEPTQGQGVTQSLIEALAKERELKRLADAERDIALQLETNPATIREQNSKDVEQKTQDETAKGIAGVLEKRQSDMQANINRAAQGPKGGIQVATGIPATGRQMATYANGGIIPRAIDWAKENPLDALSYGMMLIPGLGWAGTGALRGGLLAYKLARAGTPAATKLGRFAQKHVPKMWSKQVPYKPKPGQTTYRNPKTGRMESLDPKIRATKGLGSLPTSSQFSPMRASFWGGTGLGMVNSLTGDGEPEAQERNISEGKFGPGSLKGLGPAYPPVTTPEVTTSEEQPKTGISDEFLATLRGARKGDITGARMAYKAGQAESELEKLKFQSLDSYRQLTATQTGINNLMQQKAKLLEELASLRQTDPIFQSVNQAEMELRNAMQSGDNSKITAAQEEVARAQQEAMRRWEEKNPAEAKALRDIDRTLSEARARQSNVSTNWMGSSPTTSDLKVRRKS